MTKTIADDTSIPEDAKSYAVTESGKFYWNKRNSLGQFVRWDGTNRSDRGSTLAAWHAYLAARYEAAERATRGNLVNLDGYRRNVRPSNLLRPGGSLRYASVELVDWLAENGETLSYAEFRAQSALRNAA
jgi:hypothetical protein